MSVTSPPDSLPRWITPRAVVIAAAVLCALVWAVAAAWVVRQRADQAQQMRQSAELYARVMEDLVGRSLAVADLSMRSLEGALPGVDPGPLPASAGAAAGAAEPEASTAPALPVPALDPAQAQSRLLAVALGLPFVRSLSIVDARGRVLASSSQSNQGRLVPAGLMAGLAQQTGLMLGPWVAGRDLGAAAPAAAGGTGPGWLPLARPVRVEGRPGGAVVAALNPDWFATQFELLLDDERWRAALLSYDGRVLTTSSNLGLAPGASAVAQAGFRATLTRQEHASQVGVGVQGDAVVSAYRAVRKLPWLVQAEIPESQALAPTVRGLQAAVLVSLLLSLAGAAAAAAAVRSLRAHADMGLQLAAADALRQSREQELRVLIEGVHEWLFRTDVAGHVTFVNRRWHQLSGYPDEQALGQRVSHWVAEGDRARVDALFVAPGPAGESLAAPAAEPIELRTADARAVLIELGVSALHDAGGRLIGFAGFAVDVSEREAARRRLQDQLKFIELLVEASPMPVFVKDRQGRYLMTNRAWSRMLHVSGRQARTRQLSEIIPGADADLHERTDRQAMAQRDPVQYESRLMGADGQMHDLMVSKVRYLGPDGEPAGVIGSLVDVTRFREAERSNAAARQATEAANRARTEFIANITHELRTPLQSIIGFSELGEARAAEQVKLQQMFTRIQGAGRRMLALVNNLLDVSKIESGVGGIDLQRSELTFYVGEVLSEFDAQFDTLGLQLDIHLAEGGCEVELDPTRFQQVVRNVVANAARYAPRGSVLEVTVSVDGADAVVEVRDHGPGIPAGEFETIFEPFVQSSITKDGSGGTGLGLAICRKIMGAHRGSIQARNHPEGGAIFRITLPKI